MKVSFMVAGAQKGGTTALAQFLAEHPDICMSQPKEVHYFDNEAIFRTGGDEAFYHRHFAHHAGESQIGEATPVYMYYPHVWPRLAAYNPALKLIVLLREPVARAYSHHTMAVNSRRDWLPFSLAIRLEPFRLWRDSRRLTDRSSRRRHSYIDRGHYVRQIRHMLAHFPREQMLFLRSEDLKADHAGTLARIFDFLGVDADVAIPPSEVNAAAYQAPMHEADRRYLAERLHPQLGELEDLLGWDLSAWRT